MPSLQPETICDLQRLKEFEAEWDGLFARIRSASPFQSPAWLITWWGHFARGDLRVFVLRDGDEVVAIFPLYVETKTSGLRELKWIGAGISDYLEPLVIEGDESSNFGDFFKWLGETSHEWDKCVFEGLRRECALVEFSRVGRSADKTVRAPITEPCLVAQLPQSIDEWRRSISSHLRENIRYCWRRAERTALLTLREANDENLVQAVETFFASHKARWESVGERVADELVEPFYREVAARLSPAGLLRLYVLDWGEQAVAAVFGFVHQKTFYIHLTAFDPRFAKHSFGTLAINAAVEKVITEGCTLVDFLRGREDYKYRFGAKEKAMVTLSCTAQDAKGIAKSMALPCSSDILAT